jgi:hypothetical protein
MLVPYSSDGSRCIIELYEKFEYNIGYGSKHVPIASKSSSQMGGSSFHIDQLKGVRIFSAVSVTFWSKNSRIIYHFLYKHKQKFYVLTVRLVS